MGFDTREDKTKKRVYFWKNEIIAEIRHDSLFHSPNALSGFTWDSYKDVNV